MALALVVAYVLFVFWLLQSGRLQKWNLSLMLGFALMVRTQRGKGLIEAIARPKRFWNFMGDLGTVVILLGMVGMTAIFLWSVVFALTPSNHVEPLGASEILVIPGVNPFVPLWYGLIALIVTLVVHEGAHGVLARANDLRVKSLGLLIAVIPIGAFVEPDEDDLKATSRRKRLRVFSAGPGVNLSVALLCLIGFSAMVGATTPAPGVHVAFTVANAPSDKAGIAPGDIFLSADGQSLPDWEAFRAFLDAHHPGDNVTLQVQHGRQDTVRAVPVTLESRWDALSSQQKEQAVGDNATLAEELQRQPFLGVQPLLPENTRFLSHPFTSRIGVLSLVSLPVGEVRGQPFLSLYLPSFFDTPFEPAVYWPIATLLFWVFWINLMVGLTNILPMVPLDGGHVFRDVVGGALERLRPNMDPSRRGKVVGWAAGAMSLIILGALLLQIVGPRLLAAFQ